MGKRKRTQEVVLPSEIPIGEESGQADGREETSEEGRPPGENSNLVRSGE